MASDGNSYSPPINRSAAETSPTLENKEHPTQVSSPINHPTAKTSLAVQDKEQHTLVLLPVATLPSTSRSSSPTVSIRSLKAKYLSGNDGKSAARASTRIFISTPEVTMMNISQRLRIRKALHQRLAFVSDIMCFFGIVGIILMVIENELTFHEADTKNSKVGWYIKLIISITTAILLALICYYHCLDLKLYANQNSLENWGVGLTKTKLCLIVIELLVCAVHPMPRSYINANAEEIALHAAVVNSTVTGTYPLSYTDIDVGLGLPMFCRLYMVSRSILFHSYLVRDASLRSIGYLNQVSINFFFLMKTYLELWPTRCSIGFCTIVFFIGSWSLRACDYTAEGEHLPITDAMWLFIITFTTVGYGDLYPSTDCGRCIAALVGILGILLAALFVAILTQKLLLKREERYVHTFVLDMELAKHRQTYAANIIKFSMKMWYMKRKGKSTGIQHFQLQQKVFRSMQRLKQTRREQRSLTDSCVGFQELMTIERNASDHVAETVPQMMAMKAELTKIDKKLNNMSQSMDILQDRINDFLDKVTK